jgi:hypothetical protein
MSEEQKMVLETLYQRLDDAVTIKEQERIFTAIRKLENESH